MTNKSNNKNSNRQNKSNRQTSYSGNKPQKKTSGVESVVLSDDEIRRYAKLSKSYLRPPGSYKRFYIYYQHYTKKQILDMLNAPETNEQGLRRASLYLYDMSSHYRRLINHFAKLPTYDYYLTPLKVSKNANINEKSFRSCYRKAVEQTELMNLKHEMMKAAVTCFREDVFYGYEISTKDSYFIQKLNPDYCRLSGIEDGVYIFEFDFLFFNLHPELLDYYGSEFRRKYKKYKESPSLYRWQEIDSKNSVCLKFNEDEIHVIPPFAGTFADIYDIADYKQIMKAKVYTQNYKLLFMKIPFENGRFKLPESIAASYYEQFAEELPEGIGLAMSPMDVGSVDFDSPTSDTDSVVQSENNFWRASGASNAILGKDDLTSSSALLLSIEADAALTYGLLRQMERWINKKLKNLSGTYHFKLTFLNTTIYNRGTVQSQLMTAAQYSFPVKLQAAAAYGLSPSDMEGLLVLENDILRLQDSMIPVASSHTQSSEIIDVEKDVGRPAQETVDESGEKTQENDSNDKR